MAWTVKYDPDTDIVKVVYSGYVNSPELKAAATMRIDLQKKFQVSKVLVDASRIEELVAGAWGVFALPNELYVSLKADRKSRMALVLPKRSKAREDALFFETACINRGWTVKSFDEGHEAFAWLMATSPSKIRLQEYLSQI